jgi:acetylornithine deacetylase/succinyl-diaminopimelate desuccinylase-like protein
MRHEAIELLSRYLRINTTNPPGNERKGAQFFAEIFEKEGIAYKIHEPTKGRASISARITGKGRDDPLILLNHIDVVLAEKEQWSFDPFGGEIKDGYVHGRGAMDMKGQGIAELMAFLEIKRKRQVPNRDVIFLAVADEENGGAFGADYLLKSHYGDFSAGLVLNEGGFGLRDLLPDRPVFLISTAEKAANWIRVSCEGPPGHGSVPQKQNALERLIRALNRLQDMDNPVVITDVTSEYFRKLAETWAFLKPYLEDNKEETLIKCLTESGLSEIPQMSAILRNTISTNVISGGSKINVIPSRVEAKLDVRLLPGQDPDRFLAKVKKELGDEGVKADFIVKDRAEASPIFTDEYRKIEKVFSRRFPDAVVVPSLLFGSSDSRFFRKKGITSYGVFPVLISMNDIKMVHGIDEKISEENLVMGSEMFTEIVNSLCGI